MSYQLATPEILDTYASMRERSPGMSGFFVADSDRVVLKLLESDLKVESVLATPDWYARHPIVSQRGVTLYTADKAQLEKLVGFDLHQGVMARAQRPTDQPLTTMATGPVVILDGIAKSENVGAIIRNAAAFGFKNVLLGPDTCHPYNRRAVRVSMGNVFSMNIHQSENLAESLAILKTLGTTLYAFENREFAQDLPQVTFPTHSGFMIGSEGAGISEKLLPLADHYVRIPIDTHVYALNAACASAVAMYAFTRQIAPPLPK
jgi:RNA methyltransferase, TrmH family